MKKESDLEKIIKKIRKLKTEITKADLSKFDVSILEIEIQALDLRLLLKKYEK